MSDEDSPLLLHQASGQKQQGGGEVFPIQVSHGGHKGRWRYNLD